MTATDYINQNFPQIKTQLSWSDSTDVAYIIDKALEMYGVATEGAATDLVKLHALLDYSVWKRALNDISLDYAFSADQASFNRNQAVEQVRDNMLDAQSKALKYLADYKIKLKVDDSHDDWTA